LGAKGPWYEKVIGVKPTRTQIGAGSQTVVKPVFVLAVATAPAADNGGADHDGPNYKRQTSRISNGRKGGVVEERWAVVAGDR
jgi:hypothetical protein